MLLQAGRRTVFPYISSDIARVAGVTADEVMGDGTVLDGLLFDEDRDRFYHAVQESAAFLEPLDVIVRHRTFSGEIRWIHHWSTPHVLADESVLWDGVLLDVTAERILEEALLHLHDTATRGERTMRDLLASVSHQVRNALSPIPYGLALLEYRPGNLDVERQVAGAISAQVEHITRLLDKLDTDGSYVTPLPSRPLAREALSSTAQTVAETNFGDDDGRWNVRVAIEMLPTSPLPAARPTGDFAHVR